MCWKCKILRLPKVIWVFYQALIEYIALLSNSKRWMPSNHNEKHNCCCIKITLLHILFFILIKFWSCEISWGRLKLLFGYRNSICCGYPKACNFKHKLFVKLNVFSSHISVSNIIPIQNTKTMNYLFEKISCNGFFKSAIRYYWAQKLTTLNRFYSHKKDFDMLSRTHLIISVPTFVKRLNIFIFSYFF